MKIQLPRLTRAATRLAVTACLTPAIHAAPPAAAEPAVHWRELADPSRSSHSMVWDTRRDRAIMLGGDYSFGTPGSGVWELIRDARPHWRLLPTLGSGPFPRAGMSAVYDSLRDRVLVFGGRSGFQGHVSNELWSLSLADAPEWSKLDVSSGPSPTARFDASLVLDSRDRLVLFGGDWGGAGDSDMWVLPLTSFPLMWHDMPLAGPGPGPRARHGAVYCPVTDRITVFGGERGVLNVKGVYKLRPAVTWELVLSDPSHWVPRSTAPADSSPAPESGGVLVADPSGESATLVPGDQGYGHDDPSVWRIDLLRSVWTRMPASGSSPGLRSGAAACMVPGTRELLIHGGGRTVYAGYTYDPSPLGWILSVGSAPNWSALTPRPGNVASSTHDARVHFDPATHRLFAWNAQGVWTYDYLANAGWRLDATGATNAPLIEDAVSVVDPVRRQLLVFGGRPDFYQLPDAEKLWSWPLDGAGEWKSSPIRGESEPVWGMQSVYDAKRDRAIVIPSSPSAYSFDGIDLLVTLELGSGPPRWVRVSTQGAMPAVRSDAALVLDTTRDRLILAGGTHPTPFGGSSADTRLLPLSGVHAWSDPLPYSATPTYAGSDAALFLDPTLDRMVMMGGAGGSLQLGLSAESGGVNQFAVASLESFAGWTNMDPDQTSPIFGASVGFFDAPRDRALIWNGTLWEVTWAFGTPTALGDAWVRANTGGVHLHWPGPVVSPYAATVDRSADGGVTWTHLTSASPLADGSLNVTDSTPPVGGPLVYRVVIERGGELRVIGTAALSGSLGPPTVRPTAFALAPLRPNPARDNVTLELASPTDTDVTVEVFDTAGQRVGVSLQRRVTAGRVAFTVPLARGLPPGLYLVRAGDGRHGALARLVIAR